MEPTNNNSSQQDNNQNSQLNKNAAWPIKHLDKIGQENNPKKIIIQAVAAMVIAALFAFILTSLV